MPLTTQTTSIRVQDGHRAGVTVHLRDGEWRIDNDLRPLRGPDHKELTLPTFPANAQEKAVAFAKGLVLALADANRRREGLEHELAVELQTVVTAALAPAEETQA